MKMSLLDMTQDILNDMDADEVDSIDDTVESQQVANIIKTVFNDMISNRDWPHLKRLRNLDASGLTSKPTHMRLPDGSKKVVDVRYDKAKLGETTKRYEPVTYLYPDEFLDYTNKRRTDADNVQEVIENGARIMILTDKAPSYYTSFDDEYLVFDSFNSEVEDTLMDSKTQVTMYVEPGWTHSDSFVPNLPEEAFSALLAEAKSTAFYVLKQMTNEKAEQVSRRQNTWLSRKAWKAKGGVRYPDYGRKRNGR